MPFKDESFHFMYCERLWWDLRKQTHDFAIKEKQPTSKGVVHYCFDVIYWYFSAKKTQKQLDRCCGTCSVGSQTSPLPYNEPTQYVSPNPTSPLFALKRKMYPLQLNPLRPECIMSVYLVLGEEKQRYQSKATMLLLWTPPHCGVKAGIIAGVLEYTVNLKPLILSVSSSFHHSCSSFYSTVHEPVLVLCLCHCLPLLSVSVFWK